MTGMWYNIHAAVAGRPESNTEAPLSGTDVLVYLVADPMSTLSGNCYQPPRSSVHQLPDSGAFLHLKGG
jgi:hypothetical protein